jgi:hypothetical protein
MSQLVHTIFRHTESPLYRDRAKFLSRVFGIFSEQIVWLWAAHERAPYQNLGRPTIRIGERSRGFTLDFALRDRSSGNIYVSEMKCEIEYQNFRYFVLDHAAQLEHHKKPAFDAFLRAARPTSDQTVQVGGKDITNSGAILIWGAITPEGRDSTMRSKGFHEVLSVAEICQDLASWKCKGYSTLLEHRQKWCNELFNGLLEGLPR